MYRPTSDCAEVARELLRELHAVGIAAAAPQLLMPKDLPEAAAGGRVFLLALGKAAPAMAAAVLARRHDIAGGLVICPHGAWPPGLHLPPSIERIEAGHPLPDAGSFRAGKAALALADSLGRRDLLIACISGGGSALMEALRPGVTPAAFVRLQENLLASGASIHEINAVRIALSAVKGGGLLARAAPAHLHSYVLSDIPGDDAALVASGPTIWPHDLPDPLQILDRYGIETESSIRDILGTARCPSPVAACEVELIGGARVMLDAVARRARRLGLAVIMQGDRRCGDAVAAARADARLARRLAGRGRASLIVSGGEFTVRRSTDRSPGGRNRHYMLALALALGGHPAIAALAADSDGIDGSPDAAGALLLPDSLARARAAGLDPRGLLGRAASGILFAALGDMILPGPTGTNVNDLRLILITARLSRKFRFAAEARSGRRFRSRRCARD